MAKPRKKTILENWELVYTNSKRGRVERCPSQTRDENDELPYEPFVPASDRELEFGPDGHMRP